MLISRETDYTLRVLRGLSSGKKMTADDLCQQELLPKPFTYKILKRLERAGFVETQRGAEGGFRLSTDLKKVTLYDFIETMDVDRLVGSCLEPDFECEWQRKYGSSCMVHKRLKEIQEILDGKLRELSLHKVIFGCD